VKRLTLLAAAVLVAACTQENLLVGEEWRFVEVRNAGTIYEAQTPPYYDRFRFGSDGYVTIGSAMGDTEMKARYVTTFQALDIVPPGGGDFDFRYRIVDGALVLQSLDRRIVSPVEHVFLPASRFLSGDEVSGEWTSSQNEHRRWFYRDGTVGYRYSASQKNDDAEGYFRLWGNGEGALMLTTVVWNDAGRAFVWLERVTLQGDHAMLERVIEDELRSDEQYPAWTRVPLPQ
jgi:hypothetical protein